MRKAWSILLSILLGALVVGIGTGYFLHLANKDRQLLALEAEQAKATAIRTQQEQQNAIHEANQKLAQANEEVKKAQDVLKSVEQERALLELATPLQETMAKNIKDWQMVISTNQDISFKYPADSIVTGDNDINLTIAEKTANQPFDLKSSGAWLRIQPYTEQAENALKAQITSSTPAVYFIKGKILAGETGYKTNQNQEATYYKIYKSGIATHLLWIENYKYGQGKSTKPLVFEDLLGTIDFPKE